MVEKLNLVSWMIRTTAFLLTVLAPSDITERRKLCKVVGLRCKLKFPFLALPSSAIAALPASVQLRLLMILARVNLFHAGTTLETGVFLTDVTVYMGAISTEHNSSELRVIRTNAHLVDSYFLNLTMPVQIKLCSLFPYICGTVPCRLDEIHFLVLLPWYSGLLGLSF